MIPASQAQDSRTWFVGVGLQAQDYISSCTLRYIVVQATQCTPRNTQCTLLLAINMLHVVVYTTIYRSVSVHYVSNVRHPTGHAHIQKDKLAWKSYFGHYQSNHSNGYISSCIRARDLILVSILWFSRSRNPMTSSDLTLSDQKTRWRPIWRKFGIEMAIFRVLRQVET